MGRKINRFSYWLRRQSHFPVLLVGAGIVLLLFFNEETSVARTRQYDSEITELKAQIKVARDSAEFYRNARRTLMTDAEDLETVARENYNMQRPTEDVYIVTD
ncbi:MAG: septum formation initiator family protein [Muribaculaceae bacterium]|nr:septum formation initiator family protein [Muribaculaceae bacterium]